MPIIVKEGNFVEDGFLAEGGGFDQLDEFSLSAHDAASELVGIDVPNDTDPESLKGLLDSVKAIRIPFPSFADGRGFSIARQLRQMGFKGLLRAHGPILADQYPMAMRVGFDEVEIPAEHAGRQPQSQWKEAFTRVAHNYQDRVMHPTQKVKQ